MALGAHRCGPLYTASSRGLGGRQLDSSPDIRVLPIPLRLPLPIPRLCLLLTTPTSLPAHSAFLHLGTSSFLRMPASSSRKPILITSYPQNELQGQEVGVGWLIHLRSPRMGSNKTSRVGPEAEGSSPVKRWPCSGQPRRQFGKTLSLLPSSQWGEVVNSRWPELLFPGNPQGPELGLPHWRLRANLGNA